VVCLLARGECDDAITPGCRVVTGAGLRCVIFDLDGTLADTSGDLLAAANACFRAIGHGDLLGPEDAPTALVGGRAMLRLGLGRARGVAEERVIDELYPRLLAHYEADIDRRTRLYPGAIEAVATLRGRGIRVGICTNKPVHLAETLMSRLGVRGRFDALIGAGSLPVRKPDPAPLFAAIAQAGGVPGRACLVGDTITDRETGRAAGVPVVLVTFGPEGPEVARHGPEALLDAYADLPEIVEGLIGA
jgi:phosphoglycolate phosphatase